MRGVQRQIIDVPLATGVNTKSDPRALEVGALAVCENAEFDELGGLQTRKPFVKFLDGSGNAVTPIRKLAVYNDELIAFTDVAIFSYSSANGTWTQRAEYLAPKVTERTRFVSNAEQYDCDRAQLGGVTMFCWSQDVSGTVTTYIAALDTASGAVLLSPEIALASAVSPRLTVTTNRIMFVYWVSTTYYVRAYDPADLASPTEVSGGPVAMIYYDVCSDGTDILMAIARTASYSAVRVSETPTVDASSVKARTADGPISIDVCTDGEVAVAYTDGTNIVGDILTAALADSSTAVALGTAGATVNQVSVAFKSVEDSSEYRAYCFWCSGSSDDSETNWIDTAGASGAAVSLSLGVSIASHAFDHDGSIYVWCAFDEASDAGTQVAQVQNSYFLYRSDGLFIARAAANVGGGDSSSTGMLPGVQSLGSNQYAWCAVERGAITLGGAQRGYAARSPRDVTFEFDSDDARRTVQLGSTMYVAGGLVSQFDGRGCWEVGFPVFPTGPGIPTLLGVGLLTGDYYWKTTVAWQNSAGESDESTTATYRGANSLSAEYARFGIENLYVTNKSNVSIQYWRNEAAGGVGAPFYLVTSPDPSSTGTNRYIENDPTTSSSGNWDDNIADTALISKRTDPETGGILENLAPPSATIIAATQDRLFLAGISDSPHRVVYSKLREQGRVASFHEALAFEVPPSGGDITGIGFLNETLIIFKESAIYAVPGDGYDNAGGGQNYGPARLLSSDVGATSADRLALTPKGILFHSSKGWYLLNHGWSAGYVGAPVAEFDDDDFMAVHVMDSQHQIRCVSPSRILVWDYLVNQWAVWTTTDAPLASVIWNGAHHYAYPYTTTTDQIRSQRDGWDGNLEPYGLDIETPWIKLSGLQAYQSVRRILLLGEYRSPAAVRFRVAFNYEETEAFGISWVDDKHWTITPAMVGGPMQVRHTPSRRKCQAIKIRITARDLTHTDAPLGEAFRLTGLALEIGLKQGAARQLPAAQKQ